MANKPDRIRFTLLHELAHLLLKFGDVSNKQKETLCHQFSRAMLLPDVHQNPNDALYSTYAMTAE